MKTATLTFHPDLQPLMYKQVRRASTEVAFKGRQSLKHIIESLGVPHTEVGRVLVNGQEVELSYILADRDEVQVFPPVPASASSLSLDTPPVMPPGWRGEPRFLLDNHLGKLASHLRMLGFDSAYDPDADDDALAEAAVQESRLLLTRDKQLLMRKVVRFGYWVRHKQPQQQLEEVVARFNLLGLVRPFTRCMRCNTPLEPVEKQQVLHRLQPLTRQHFEVFSRCPACDQLYWRGSHYERMLTLIQELSS